MSRLDNLLYIEDVKKVLELPLEWEAVKNKKILIAGATGMIGTFLTDVFMCGNRLKGLNCKIYAFGRNKKTAKSRFADYISNPNFTFLEADINQGLFPIDENVDFVIHAASNTHPVAYATDPIGTITTNVIGTYHLLEFSASHNCERFVFVSTVEVYGENRGDTEYFTEDYCGYIDCNTLRAGYPESKRAGEALCQAYIKQKNMNIVMPRLARVYGSTMLTSDTKALSQFIKKGIAKEDIVLKSEGTQLYSYNYVADAVSAILYCLLKGETGHVYNVADKESDIRLKDLAKIIADHAKTNVVFELPDETEKAGYSKATKAVMDGEKLHRLGWQPMYDIVEGLKRTLTILEAESAQEK